MLLAGDIGGTKSSLAIFSQEKGPREPLVEATFPSGDYPSLAVLAGEFLNQIDLPVDRGSFGVAGPVVNGRATITNLSWEMDEEDLQEQLGLVSVRLLNDLLAVGHAVPILTPEDLHTLNEGKPEKHGSIAVIAPGTGLGEAFLTWDGTRYRAHASEGGHTDFAPTTKIEIGLLRFMSRRMRHVSYELVCSGIGIPNIYAYLKKRGEVAEPEWLAERLLEAKDPTPVIAQAALNEEQPCPLCVATMELFVSILGAEAGNLALKVLATGGVYLGGGIPPRILPVLDEGPFMEAFRGKGRFGGLMADMPIHVILNRKAALLGGAYRGLTEP
jgi:glucokinase